ncbi:MAG: hypothetical protein ACRD3V_29235 [Vicinamibacteria bacterium]
MRNLFRSFERFGLDYLLISGQASILYGAATFSEDLDLWIRPSRLNAGRLLEALASRRARVHKLTPPLNLRHLGRGHGFHFIIPSQPIPTYLDVMGRPPRVRSFTECRARARLLETDWGRLPVVGMEDLIALKKTRRFSDYEVISNLVSVRLSEESSPSRRLLRWASKNTFRPEARVSLLRKLGETTSIGECRRDIAQDVARLQARDTAYWRPRIAELRRLRKAGKLLPEGMPISRLLKP